MSVIHENKDRNLAGGHRQRRSVDGPRSVIHENKDRNPSRADTVQTGERRVADEA